MTITRPHLRQSREWTKIAPYAVLSLAAFLIGIGILLLLLLKAEKLVALGLAGNLYYLVLLPLGLSAAAFLFGALRSYASYSGTQFGGALELGGPVVAFFIVLVLGFWLPPPSSNFPLTVYVHGPAGPQDMILKGSGYVIVDIGGHRRKAPIGDEGAAFFPELPANFRGQEVFVALDADGYELADAQQKARLNSGSIYLPVRKLSVRIAGHVEDQSGQPVSGARISVGGLTASTDASGYFELLIPGQVLRQSLSLQVLASGYKPWRDNVVPNSNEITITLQR